MKYLSICVIAVLAAVSWLNADKETDCGDPCESEQYLMIQGTIPGSAAEDVGMREGDVIVSYNGTDVHCLKKLNMLKESVETDSIEMTVRRGDEMLTFTIAQGMIGVYLVEMLPDIDFSKEPDATVIDGIGPLAWSTGETNSFIGALARLAEHLNLEHDYTYLMGASGTAFRLHFHKDWCPSSPDPTVGYDCGMVAARCINLEPTYMHTDKEKDNAGEVNQEIVKSIDRSMPVIAIDLIEVPEWGLVVGYYDRAEKLVIRDYFARRKGYDIAQKFPWVIVTLDNTGGEIDDIKNLKHALKTAQQLYETDMYGDYYSGLAALEYWIQQLRDDDFSAYDDEKLEEIVLANAWIYQRFADDRMYGAKYLTRQAEKVPAVTDEMNKLAALYEQQYTILISEENIAPYPEYFKTLESWNDDMRAREIEVLDQVLEKEKEAHIIITEINKKLAG